MKRRAADFAKQLKDAVGMIPEGSPVQEIVLVMLRMEILEERHVNW